jgi:hypothetical protein
MITDTSMWLQGKDDNVDRDGHHHDHDEVGDGSSACGGIHSQLDHQLDAPPSILANQPKVSDILYRALVLPVQIGI